MAREVTGFHVQIKGARELAAKLGDSSLLDRILRPRFEAAATIVEGAAIDNAHRVTGKLQRSIGQQINGAGASLEARIGLQPGMGAPASYGTGDTSHWKTPRSGTNTGDPQEYGVYEEEGTRYHEPHPFLEPALDDNLGQIEDVFDRPFPRL